MANDVSQYYITQAPEITEISVTPNPVSTGVPVVISMKIRNALSIFIRKRTIQLRFTPGR